MENGRRMEDFKTQSRALLANPIFIFVVILTIANAWGFQSWRTLLNNFMVEEVALDGSQNGIVQSVREM